MTLTVRDDRPGACDSSTDQIVVAVNAAPVAVPGNQQHAATGETVRLDGGRSYDVDGKIASWTWDLGDGAKETGPHRRARLCGAGDLHRYADGGRRCDDSQ